jgi:hypothetical protein
MPPKAQKSRVQDAKKRTRITVTLPIKDYEHLCRIARTKKVSASWVVRDAVDKYLQSDIPLFGGQV